jgi:plasmid segregation protein ParM
VNKTAKLLAPTDSDVVVGVDDGYAMTKLVVMRGRKVIGSLAIPSRARSGIHTTTSIGGADDELVPCYETEGVKFTVADLPDAESARFEEYPFSGMNRAIVHHALRKAGLGGKSVRVATGLPLSSFYKGSEPNMEIIKRKTASIMTPVSCIDGSPMATLGSHNVFPEGLAAWVDYAIGDDGKLRIQSDISVGVIDIGGRTTDVAVVLPGRRIDHARCGSADIGALNVVEHVRLALLKRFEVEIPGATIEAAFRTGSIRMWGKPHDIRKEIEAAVSQTMDGVWREANRRLGNAVDIDEILLVGGGVHLFRSMAKRYPNVKVVDQPEYANARGFAKYLSL